MQGPTLVVEGGALHLPEVRYGETAYPMLVLRNAGSAPLTLDTTELLAEPAWRAVGWPSMPLLLLPDAQLALRLAYTPADGGSEGAVWIESDDFNRPRLHVPIGTLRALPSLVVSDPETTFGAVPSGASQDKVVRLANSGNGPVALHEVRLAQDSSRDFSLEMEAIDSLVPGEWCEMTISYRPTGGGADYGAVVVTTDDPTTPRLVMPLVGEQVLPEVY